MWNLIKHKQNVEEEEGEGNVIHYNDFVFCLFSMY